jgi:hypothetical protein
MKSVPAFLLLLSLFVARQVEAQFDQKSVKGNFYVSVDDSADIYVNGTKVFHADIGETRSEEVELKTGDRVVAQLRDVGGERRFAILFASTDGQTIVSFRSRDLKIVPDVGTTDFTPEQLEKWTKSAKDIREKVRLPIKSSSEVLWGELGTSILAGVVTSKMFSQRSR